MKPKINYTRPPLFPYQTEIIDCPARFTWTEASTKVGKSASHLVWLFEQPLALNLKAGQAAWWIAPVYGQAEVMFHRLKNQLSNKDFISFNESKLRATYATGAEMQFKSAEKPDNLYGDDVYAFVFDEFTRAREEAYHALRTTITSTGGRGKFIGNVKGRKNWGHRMAMKAKNGEDPDSRYFKITAYDAADAGMLTKDGRPLLEEIEAAKRDLPENVFNELYLAEASEDGSNPFGVSYIAKCIYPLSSRAAVCFGIDLAKTIDWTVIIGLDEFGQVCYFDRFQKDWRQTTQEILSLPQRPTAIDSTGVGDPIGEDIASKREAVELFKFTPRSKQQLMEGLAYGIQKRELSFPDGPSSGQTISANDPGHIKLELESFEFEYTRTGVLYTCPTGMHDDCVAALGLAKKIHANALTYGQVSIW